MFDDNKYRRNFRMFEKIARPSSTAATMEAKLSSASTMSAACLDTSVPVMPIAIPMSADFKAGASLTPSPVIATTEPWLCSAFTIRSLCSGFTRANTDTSRIVSSERLVRHPFQLGAGHGSRIARDPELPGDDRGSNPMVAGNHDRPYPGALRARDGLFRLVTRRIDDADQVRQIRDRVRSARPRSRHSVCQAGNVR